MRDLMPWRENAGRAAREHPLLSLQREMDALFADPWASGAGTRAFANADRFFPRLNLSETVEGYRVTAELPGMEEKEVNVSFDGNLLLISGHKQDEKEEKGREWYRRERAFGEFQRAVELPATIDAGKTTASFKHGVLVVDVPKRTDAKIARRNVEVKPG